MIHTSNLSLAVNVWINSQLTIGNDLRRRPGDNKQKIKCALIKRALINNTGKKETAPVTQVNCSLSSGRIVETIATICLFVY